MSTSSLDAEQQKARDDQQALFAGFVARYREIGPAAMAAESHNPARFPGSVEALEAKLSSLLGTGEAAA